MAEPTEQVIAQLRARLGDRVTTAMALRDQHSRGEDPYPTRLPDAVAFAESNDDVVSVLSLCHAHHVSVVPFGAGTSLEGHVTPVRGGISLDLSRMNGILAVNGADLDCQVQAGVTRQALNRHLRDKGLFFPVDPGSECTIGGMCATRASGTCAVRYGTIRENVLGLTAVLADGRVVRTGGRVRKSATGYDLTHLLIGSEGTLGVITEITLRLHGIPEAISAALCQFERTEDAVDAVIALMQAGLPMARIEFLDEVQMAACLAYRDQGKQLPRLTARPTLMFELHGSPAGVTEQSRMLGEIVADHYAIGFLAVHDADERAQLWKLRHDAYWAAMALRPGYRGLTTDAIVPISKLTDLIIGAKADIAASGLIAPIVGHVGDGNFHTAILVPPEPDGLQRAQALDQKITARALALGGSCSGEHGVGLGKRGFMASEHGETGLAMMRQIKTALDPHGILNPGKLLPDAESGLTADESRINAGHECAMAS